MWDGWCVCPPPSQAHDVGGSARCWGALTGGEGWLPGGGQRAAASPSARLSSALGNVLGFLGARPERGEARGTRTARGGLCCPLPLMLAFGKVGKGVETPPVWACVAWGRGLLCLGAAAASGGHPRCLDGASGGLWGQRLWEATCQARGLSPLPLCDQGCPPAVEQAGQTSGQLVSVLRVPGGPLGLWMGLCQDPPAPGRRAPGPVGSLGETPWQRGGPQSSPPVGSSRITGSQLISKELGAVGTTLPRGASPHPPGDAPRCCCPAPGPRHGTQPPRSTTERATGHPHRGHAAPPCLGAPWGRAGCWCRAVPPSPMPRVRAALPPGCAGHGDLVGLPSVQHVLGEPPVFLQTPSAFGRGKAGGGGVEGGTWGRPGAGSGAAAATSID